MSKKEKPQKFTFRSVIRLLIFTAIIYFSINWLSSQQKDPFNLNNDPTLVLGEETTNNLIDQVYQQLPEKSRHQIENFNQSEIVTNIQEKLNGFPQKQIKDLQKSIIKTASENIIKNIDQQ